MILVTEERSDTPQGLPRAVRDRHLEPGTLTFCASLATQEDSGFGQALNVVTGSVSTFRDAPDVRPRIVVPGDALCAGHVFQVLGKVDEQKSSVLPRRCDVQAVRHAPVRLLDTRRGVHLKTHVWLTLGNGDATGPNEQDERGDRILFHALHVIIS
jgi:hypothetical protein